MFWSQQQKPYGLTLKPVVRKRPNYVPDPPADAQPIHRLIFQGKETDTKHLIDYIHKKLNDDGVLYTLVNRLYEMRGEDLCFYMPELVYMAVKRNCTPIIKFLTDRVKLSLQDFCLVYWNVQAFGFQMKEKSPDIRSRLDGLERDLRLSMFNSERDLQLKGVVPTHAEVEEMRKLRNEHFVYSSKFINKLVKTSLDLKLIPEPERKDKLKKTITLLNQWLRLEARNHRDKNLRYYEGVTIPFRKEPDHKYHSTLMVSIIEDDCSCYNTRKRVPYRIIIETIDIQELVKHSPVRWKNSDKEKTIVSKGEPFFDDLLDLSVMMIAPILDEAPKYKELGNFAKKVIKEQEREKKLTGAENADNKFFQNMKPFASGLQDLVRQANEPNRQPPIPRQNQPHSFNPFSELFHPQQRSIPNPPPTYAMPINHLRPAINKEQYERGLAEFQINFEMGRKIKRRNSTGDACKISNRTHPILNRRQTRVITPDAIDHIKRVRYYSQRKGKKANNDRTSLLDTIHQKIKDPVKIRKIESINERVQQQQEKDPDRAYQQKWVNGQGPIRTFEVWDQKWKDKVDRYSKNSEYKAFESYKLRNCIVKGGDDLRQEIVCMQLIYKFQEVFRQADPKLYLRPYEIIVLNESSGILEFVTNSISIDGLKKKVDDFNSLYDFYKYRQFTKQGAFEEAQDKFLSSLAAYSLLTYLLQIKDRHNGNILIDDEGHIIHIDFGFIFCISPGGWNFQTSPFKMTAEYIEMLEGKFSQPFQEFRRLFKVGFQKLRENVESICSIVTIMSDDSDLPCFHQFSMPVFRDRFKENLSDLQFDEYCDSLIEQSCFNWRTVQYDYFQHYTNEIAQ